MTKGDTVWAARLGGWAGALKVEVESTTIASATAKTVKVATRISPLGYAVQFAPTEAKNTLHLTATAAVEALAARVRDRVEDEQRRLEVVEGWLLTAEAQHQGRP